MSAPVTAQLIMIQGDDTFEPVIDLNSVNRSIGRAQNCDIIWGSLQISRKHATLEYMVPKWYIRDTSTNGLSVNGTKLTKGAAVPLNDADIISFIPTGSVRYRFRYIYNSTSRINSPPTAGNATPQASTSTSRNTRPLASSSKGPLTSSRSRLPSVEEIDSSNSDSEESNHSESLLDLDQPEDFLSFSGDERDQAPSPLVVDESDDDSSSAAFSSKRKHPAESDNDSNSLDCKKKRLISLSPPSSIDGGCMSREGSPLLVDEPCFSLPSPSPNSEQLTTLTGFLTEDQIASCTDMKTLKVQLRKCLTSLSSTKLKLQTVECERSIEQETFRKKENDVKSLTTAIREENLRKILELMESELSCAVCNEVFIQSTVVDCGHTFCSFCINEWSRKKQECPICRKQFRNKSRHVELENFITRMYDAFNEETSQRRKTSIKEREEQIEKAEAARTAQANMPRPPHGMHQANLHTFMQRTAETYVDFLAELHQFNELLVPRPRGGRGGNASAGTGERRRSARIQVQGAAAPEASRPTARRSVRSRSGGRGRNARPVLPTPSNPIPPPPPTVAPPVVDVQFPIIRPTRRQNNNNDIPVVDLDDSNNAGEQGNNSPFGRLPSQLFNLFF